MGGFLDIVVVSGLCPVLGHTHTMFYCNATS